MSLTKVNVYLLLGVALLGACASLPVPRAESVYALTTGNRLISFNAGRPGMVSSSTRISGLQPSERLLGMDFRPTDGKLYAFGSSRRLYVLDIASGAATQVGVSPLAVALEGDQFGFNFNPLADKIRLVSNTGENLRLNPDTGAVVDADPNTPGLQLDRTLAYATSDSNAGSTPHVIAVAYTNSIPGVKATTNFAIDSERGLLLTQGSREGLSLALTPVSPNSGQLFTVGSLGTPGTRLVAFDIAATSNPANVAFAALGTVSGASRFYIVDLNTGAATFIGEIAGGEAIVAISIAPQAK